ncbi:hypothetical protein AMELA_G00251910 [Ameiurus melas]|uniref:Uncharacterized protein n=1 Tax=Ameiurus melas TaxID=219545 RepID=A0A7J5ZSB7_AMEME|nr:hypothetical protein AMELA_G00251910 [Ameiurus melas]
MEVRHETKKTIKPGESCEALSLVEEKKSDRSGSADESALRGASDVIFAAEGRWRGTGAHHAGVVYAVTVSRRRLRGVVANSSSSAACSTQMAFNPSAVVWFEVAGRFIIRTVYVVVALAASSLSAALYTAQARASELGQSYTQHVVRLMQHGNILPRMLLRAPLWDPTEQLSAGANAKGTASRPQVGFRDGEI